MVKVSVAVMAHPSRSHFIPSLLERLPHGTPVVWDRIQSRWDTGRRSMLEYDSTATHHLVIQDDSILCDDLITGLEAAIPYVDIGSPLCLYLGRVRPYGHMVRSVVGAVESASNPISWLTMNKINWGPGIVVPVAQIPPMIEYCDKRGDANYDRRLSRWFEYTKRRVWYPWPSLVEHRDSPSLIEGRVGGRHAYRFIGEGMSALSVDWSGGVVAMPEIRRRP